MEYLPLFIYLADTIVDKLFVILIIVLCVLVALHILAFIAWSDARGEKEVLWAQRMRKCKVKYYVVLCLSITLIPSSDTIYKVFAANVGVEIIQSPQATELGNKSLKAINKVLDEYLGEEINEND